MSKIETVLLENGLTIYLYQDTSKHSTLFQFVTRFGGLSKDFQIGSQEYCFKDGIAHILEHYIVECNACGNFLKLLGEKQMLTNAYTYLNMTRFYFEAVEDLEYGIKTLLQGIYSPIFDEGKLKKIKDPIYQEIRGKMDNKFYHSNQMMLNNLFHQASFRSIGGTLEEVKQLTLEQLKLCYDTFYQPTNQFIIVGGNFDKEKVLEQIKTIYQKIQTPSCEFKKLELVEPKEVRMKRSTLLFPTPQPYVEVDYKISLKHLSNQERLKLDFYIHYFCDMFFGLTSPLYQKLVREKIITTGLSYGDDSMNDFLILSVGAYTDYPDILEEEILKTVRKMNFFHEETFELDRNHSMLKVLLRKERLLDYILPFVGNLVDFNYPYPDKKEDVEAFSFEDFKTIIASLDFNQYTVVTIANPEKKEK